MSAPRLLLALLALTLAAAACPADPRDQTKHIVARAGPIEIRESELLVTLAQHGTARIPDAGARATVARAILSEMVTERLILGAADKAGITARDDEVDREVRTRAEGYPPGVFQRLLVAEQLTLDEFREKVRRRLVQDAFLRARLAEAPPITEEELHARFDKTLKDQEVPEQVRARQILVRTSEEASHVLEQVRSRKIGFETAATNFSTAPDAEKGGDLGWFSKGDMPDVFDVCFNLEKGTISDVVASDYGFHIFQILDRRDAHKETFDAARDRVEEEIMRERQEDGYQKLMLELRAANAVSVVEESLARVVSLLPPAPVTPAEVYDKGSARALDSLPSAINPLPPLQKGTD